MVAHVGEALACGAASPEPGLRVLAVIDGLHLAGAQKLLLGLARQGRAAGIDLEVVTLESPGSTATILADLHAAGVRVWTLDAEGLFDLRAALRLARLIRAGGFDLVHAHLRYAITMAPVVARLTGTPSVCSFHHVPTVGALKGRIKEWLAVRSSAVSDAVLTVSRAQLRGFERRYRIGRPGRWQVLHNGIDLEPFVAAAGGALPDDLRARTGPGPAVVMVARLLEGKGHEVAVGAWRHVLERVPSASLLLVGDGPLDVEVAAQVDRSGIRHRVVFAGARRDVPAIMAGAALVVLPSDSEALPTVLIEAAATATAVVATRVGGIPEIVDHGRTGLLVPVGDLDAFAGSVAELLEDDVGREAMGRTAQRLVLDRFEVARWATRTATLYREVVARRRRRRRVGRSVRPLRRRIAKRPASPPDHRDPFPEGHACVSR